MAAVRHLGLLKVANFNIRSGSEGRFASPTKFREDRSNRSGDMADFRFSRLWPSAILDLFTRVGTTHEEYLVVFMTVQNVVVIGTVISIVCKF